MTIEHFLGCVEAAVMKWRNVIQAMTLSNEITLPHKDITIHIFKIQGCWFGTTKEVPSHIVPVPTAVNV